MAWPRPPGIQPTAFLQKPKIWSVTPPLFMMLPARIKKARAIRVKELGPAIVRVSTMLMLSPKTVQYSTALHIMQKATGIPMMRNRKNKPNNNAIVGILLSSYSAASAAASGWAMVYTMRIISTRIYKMAITKPA